MVSLKKHGLVCRFAPSPTGPLHVGGVRSALFNYFFARQSGGKLILRIEDTDKERSKKEYENDIVDGFKWLGLSFDETYRQSDRTEIYKTNLEKLIASGNAYVSKEEAGPEKRSEVIRFKNPNKVVVFNDLIKGEISFDTKELGDFVIAKSMSEPIYHLAVVSDDIQSSVTHIIRGEDHISNTPRQILIAEALGAKPPSYAHLPLLLSTDKSKLSKRKHGESVSLGYYIKQGYLPEALINYLALLGWNPGNDREMYSLEDLVKIFSFGRTQKSNAVFDQNKLRWFNKQYLSLQAGKKTEEEISRRLETLPSYGQLLEAQKEKITELVMERIDYFAQIDELLGVGELSYFTVRPQIDTNVLRWKDDKDLTVTKEKLLGCAKIIETLPEFPDVDLAKQSLMIFADKEGRGSVLWPLRYALTGLAKSPDPFTVINILGRDESLERVKSASNLIK